MISGKRKTNLTAEEILKKLTAYDIYKYYFGSFRINDATYNHLRGESKNSSPSFIISNRYGELLHHDFSDEKWKGNCFQLVQQIFNCSYDEALRTIDKDFGLGILPENNSGKYKQIKKEYRQPIDEGKRYSLIQMVTRKFTEEELYYWRMYYQTIEDLKRENVHSIKEMYINKKRYPIPEEDLRFGYLEKGGYWKFYRPFQDKKKKWISNVPITLAYGLENLDKHHNTLIAKSKKDYMVCKKVYPYTCGIQNESMASFSEETIKYIKENSKDVFYAGDSDEPGKKNSWIITENFGFKHINPPDQYLPEINDFAEWAKCCGLLAIKDHFIKKGLYEN